MQAVATEPSVQATPTVQGPPLVVESGHYLPAASNKLEVSVGGGYARGGGKIGSGNASLEDVSSAGGSIELELQYRIAAAVGVGIYGVASRFQRGDALAGDNRVWGSSAGLQATLHFSPSTHVDPWVSIGAGWKSVWLDPAQGQTTSLQGPELARVQLGTDFRASRAVAIAPVIGASLSSFVAEKSAMTMGYDEISNKKLDVSIFAGIKGRFDL